ncbi:hypothetical protein [Bacteroides thetaiotaomicron]|uniref:hypothetical protein n=1 Tax=Bacteroides thetaiotaomicron TaxID=818 RepID=UPI00293EBC78|nr:hypothetical protein [Bacteroides thetaiotaomicron]
MSMAAVIHGAESRYEVEDFGNAKIDLFPRTVARIWNLPSVTIPLIVFSVL